MTPLFLGIQYGLFLALLVGPLLVALIQAGVEQGKLGGVVVGTGIWVSDLFFIVTVYLFMSEWNELASWPLFTVTVGGIGSLILMCSGLLSLKRPPLDLQTQQTGAKGYVSLWMKGFLINTINPFTVFFWMFVMSSVILPNEYTPQEATVFFSGILGTIVSTDLFKIHLCDRIYTRLKERTLRTWQRLSSIALIFFGIVLLARSLYSHVNPV